MSGNSPDAGAARWEARNLRAYARVPVILTTAAVAMALFVEFLPPIFRWEGSAISRLPPLSALPADLAVYSWRFALCFLLLGLLPLGVGWRLGFGPRSLGLCGWDRSSLPSRWLAVLLAAAGLIGMGGAFDPGIAAYYPYARSMPELVRSHGVGVLAAHALLYCSLYYLPWEFFFRGFLLRPLVDLLGTSARGDLTPEMIALASVQVIPSALLHLGHPLNETLAAIPFGLAMGILVLRTRSVVPGFLIHAVIGLATDTTLLLRQPGGLR